jgi:hypothetical protein
MNTEYDDTHYQYATGFVMAVSKFVGVNDNGRRIGESHPLVKLSDHDVELIRDLNSPPHSLSYYTISVKFEVSRSCIAKICQYKTRCDIPVRWKKVLINNGDV